MNICKPTESQNKIITELKTVATQKISAAQHALLEWIALEKSGSATRVQTAINNLNTVMAKDPERDICPVDVYISMLKQHINNIWLTHTPQNPIA